MLQNLPAKVQAIIEEEFTAVPAAADLQKLNADFRQQHQDSPEHLLSASRTARLLGEDQGNCENELIDALQLSSISFEHAAAMLDTLRQWGGSGATSFQQAAREKWPEVSAFA